MIDWTKPVRTIDGHHPVRVLCTDREGSDYPVVAITKFADGSTDAETYTLEGSFQVGTEPVLENVPEKHAVYLNAYRSPYVNMALYHTREEADANAGSSRIACVRVEFTEGQFDE